MFSDSVCYMWQDVLNRRKKTPLPKVCIWSTLYSKTSLAVICYIYSTVISWVLWLNFVESVGVIL